VSEQRRRVFARDLGVEAVDDNPSVATRAQTIILAVKPQQMDSVLRQIGPSLAGDKLVISIAAGVKTSRIEAAAPSGCRVARVMPNTPMLVGKGMAAICAGANATRDDLEHASEIFRCAAEVVTVDEAAMDAVTAVSGSGPAYCFYLAEAMAEAGVAEGLDRPLAEKLAAATLRGAGELLFASGESAAELRRKVTSPGGTTEAAIRTMDKSGVREALIEAVRNAARRSRELSGS
jgi:pyrroline-5-carboxylate reductase